MDASRETSTFQEAVGAVGVKRATDYSGMHACGAVCLRAGRGRAADAGDAAVGRVGGDGEICERTGTPNGTEPVKMMDEGGMMELHTVPAEELAEGGKGAAQPGVGDAFCRT